MAEISPVPPPTDKPKPPPPPPPVDRPPPNTAVLRQKMDTEIQGKPVDRRAETQGAKAPSDQGRAAAAVPPQVPKILDATGKPVDLKAPLKDSTLDKTFTKSDLLPLSEMGKPPVEVLKPDLNQRVADVGLKKGLFPAEAPKEAPAAERKLPSIEGKHSAGDEAAAAKAIKDATKLEPGDIASKVFGKTEFSNVELKKVLVDAGAMSVSRRPLSEEVASPPAGEVEVSAPTKEQNQRDEEWKTQQAEAERRENHPNLRDVVQHDAERVGHALDPTGRQGIATGVWETLYQFAGFNPEEAHAMAQKVDSVLSLIPVAERGAATNRAWDTTQAQGTATARPAEQAGPPPEKATGAPPAEKAKETPPAEKAKEASAERTDPVVSGEKRVAEGVLPKGMSLNEMEEPLSRERYNPNAVMPGVKQEGVDLVDGHRGENWGRHDNRRDGERVYVQTLEGGNWIQIKKLDPESTAPGSKQGPVELRVRDNVNDAVAKFEKVLQDKESRSAQANRNEDGIRVTSVLKNPDRALVHIEVPGFDQMPPVRQELLRAAAKEQLGLATAPTGALWGNGTMHGVPIDVRVVDRPMPKPSLP